MSNLVKRLRIKAGIIEMGELIAWGSDSALMREAADALEMAGPAVQMEVVGWQFYQDGKWWNGNERSKDHKKNTLEAGFRVRDVYATPQPAEQKSTACVGCEGAPVSGNSPCAVCGQKSALDVSALVEALDLMVTTHDEGGWPTAAIVIARAALATYRKQGGEA